MANKQRKTYESPDIAAMMRRMARGLVRRAGEGDLEALTALREVDAVVRDSLVQAARAAHYGPQHYSWGEIARELGMTRQGACKRFALDDDEDADVEPEQRSA